MKKLISFLSSGVRESRYVVPALLIALALVATPCYATDPTYTIPDLIPNFASVLTTITTTLVGAVVACFGFAMGWKLLKVIARMVRRVAAGGGV